MTIAARLHQLSEELGLPPYKLAEAFDVNYQTMYKWFDGTSIPRPEFVRTLERYEREDPQLSPRLHPEILVAFRKRRERLVGAQ